MFRVLVNWHLLVVHALSLNTPSHLTYPRSAVTAFQTTPTIDSIGRFVIAPHIFFVSLILK